MPCTTLRVCVMSPLFNSNHVHILRQKDLFIFYGALVQKNNNTAVTKKSNQNIIEILGVETFDLSNE